MSTTPKAGDPTGSAEEGLFPLTQPGGGNPVAAPASSQPKPRRARAQTAKAQAEAQPAPASTSTSTPAASASALNGGGHTAVDPFNLDTLRLPQNFGDKLGVKKLLTVIQVRKPTRQSFVRTHPTLRLDTAIVELKDENETYLVLPAMHGELADEIVPKTLRVCMTTTGVLFIWPIKLPDGDGRLDDWNRSATEAAKSAETVWTSIRSNRAAGCYDVFEATGKFPEPEWPDKSLLDLLRIAFRDRVIDTLDHAVIQRLRGAV